MTDIRHRGDENNRDDQDNQDRQTSGLGFVGQKVKRIEDERFLIGEGTFVADINPEGVLHAVFLRSLIPHGRIRSINVSGASALKGVVRVFTGADLNAITNSFPPFFMAEGVYTCLLYTSPSPRDATLSRMPSSA